MKNSKRSAWHRGDGRVNPFRHVRTLLAGFAHAAATRLARRNAGSPRETVSFLPERQDIYGFVFSDIGSLRDDARS